MILQTIDHEQKNKCTVFSHHVPLPLQFLQRILWIRVALGYRQALEVGHQEVDSRPKLLHKQALHLLDNEPRPLLCLERREELHMYNCMSECSDLVFNCKGKGIRQKSKYLFVLFVSLFVSFVLHPLFDSLLIITSSSINSWYLYSHLISFVWSQGQHLTLLFLSSSFVFISHLTNFLSYSVFMFVACLFLCHFGFEKEPACYM